MYLHKSDLVKQTAKVNNNRKVAFILKNVQEVVYIAYIHCMVQYMPMQPRAQQKMFKYNLISRGCKSESLGWNLEVLFIIIEQT